MITPREFMICVIAGGVLILFGFAPSLLEGLAAGIRNFVDQLSSSYPRNQYQYEQLRTPQWWLAGLGMALIVVSVLAWTSPEI